MTNEKKMFVIQIWIDNSIEIHQISAEEINKELKERNLTEEDIGEILQDWFDDFGCTYGVIENTLVNRNELRKLLELMNKEAVMKNEVI